MLHTLVQHKHVVVNDGSPYIQSCQHEVDFFGLIRHAFEIDERQNHLEEFEVAQFENIQFENAAVVIALFSIVNVSSDYIKAWPEYSVSLPTDFYIPNLSFRGPPTQS
ncbi:hypothetical protein [Fulvivirga lutea]|uniref:Uncharacterized protein n=1 Tax=Fulvivirga lutea TaxID=2810512 RepID=A0A975A1E3_9BACT|nr:hypothetical protein [Fulvivirga lutea]QSE98211.1 hypothetical protein JR347_03785 [Fulvivirga lutea]